MAGIEPQRRHTLLKPYPARHARQPGRIHSRYAMVRYAMVRPPM